MDELFGFVWVCFVGWLAAIWLLPNFEASNQNRIGNYSGTANVRTILMRGDNLRYYVDRELFESFPYPDRPAVMKELANEWCKKASPAFLPSVYLYDIKNGERLDSYNCAFGEIKERMNK